MPKYDSVHKCDGSWQRTYLLGGHKRNVDNSVGRMWITRHLRSGAVVMPHDACGSHADAGRLGSATGYQAPVQNALYYGDNPDVLRVVSQF